MAAIFFTLALFLGSPDTQLEPKVTWFFQVKACDVCILKQMDVMARLYQDGDVIELHFNSEKEDGEKIAEISRSLAEHLPKAQWVKPKHGQSLAVGWRFQDAHTGEEVIYASSKGTYNEWRSAELLKQLR